MPQVPTDFVQSVMPQGREAPEQIQASPADFGVQVGQTLQVGGNQLEQQAATRQQTANETTVNDLYANQFAPAFRSLYNQFYQLQGKDAQGQLPAYEQQMADLRNQVRDRLANLMQQRMFDLISRQRMNYELDAMARHAAQQTQACGFQTSNALLSSFVNDGIDKYNDPYGGGRRGRL